MAWQNIDAIGKQNRAPAAPETTDPIASLAAAAVDHIRGAENAAGRGTPAQWKAAGMAWAARAPSMAALMAVAEERKQFEDTNASFAYALAQAMHGPAATADIVHRLAETITGKRGAKATTDDIESFIAGARAVWESIKDDV